MIKGCDICRHETVSCMDEPCNSCQCFGTNDPTQYEPMPAFELQNDQENVIADMKREYDELADRNARAAEQNILLQRLARSLTQTLTDALNYVYTESSDG